MRTTVGAAAAAAAARLRAAGFDGDEAVRDASVIARGLLGWSPADWLSRRETDADPGFLAAFEALVVRRAAHEPVAYLLGTREFYGRPFVVAPGVLIPRPETELLIDTALAWLRAHDARAAATVVDVGTGSGCIALTIALEQPDVRITATDRSSDALAVARQNAAALGVAAIDWRLTDLLDDVPGPVDLVLSNPPYVPERDRTSLASDVRDYEPAMALFGGDDGLDVVRRLIPAAAAALRAGGRFICEVGAGQREAVTDLLRADGFRDIQWAADLQGIPRIVSAERT